MATSSITGTTLNKLSVRKSSGRVDLDKVLLGTVQIVIKHAPHQLTYSKISRLIGIPRSTLYYYFGNNVWNLLEEAARFGMKKFILEESFDNYKKHKSWKEFQIDRFEKAMELVQRHPWAPRLYFKYRDDATSLGQIVRRYETEYLKKMRQIWSHFNDSDLLEANEKVAAALKLGFLWGYAIEISSKNIELPEFEPKKFARKLSTLIEQFLLI